MSRGFALGGLTAASALLLLATAVPHPAAPAVFAAAALAFPVLLVALGVARADGRGRIPVVLAALGLLVPGSGFAVLLLSGPGAPRGTALPPGTLVLLLGLGLATLAVVIVAYAATFQRVGPPQDGGPPPGSGPGSAREAPAKRER